MSDETRKTLREFFEVNLSTAGYENSLGTDSITLSNIVDGDLGTTPTSNGDGQLDLLNFDGTAAEISVLGDYLNYITQNFSRSGPNEFFIEKHTTTANDTDRGTPIESPSTNQHGAHDTFTERNDLSDTLADYSNSQQFDIADGDNLADIINKTGDPDLDVPNGHELLSGITGDESPPAPPVASSFEILKKNNRFNTLDEKEYGYDYVKDGADEEVAFALGQSLTGSYEKNPLAQDGHSFNFEQLKNVGYEMLKAATQFSIDETDDETEQLDQTIQSAEGVSPRETDSSPFHHHYTPTDPEKPSTGAFEEAQKTQKIKKSFTSPDNTFTDCANDDLAPYFQSIVSKFTAMLLTGDDAKHTEGTRKRYNNSVYTSNAYDKSVNYAMAVLFPEDIVALGIDRDPFYSNIANVMLNIMSAEDLEAENDSGPSNARAKSDGSIAFKFLDTMAVIGDIYLTLHKKETVNNVNILNGGYNDVDDLDEGPATRISKSKTAGNGPNSKSLAWRGSSLPALYHLPSSVIASMQNMGAVNGQNPMKGMIAGGLVDKTYMSIDVWEEMKDILGAKAFLGDGVKTVNKIPKMLVQRMEDQLDAEYVPFYFHDLRTNEIISFHAFLDNLTDSFSANYEDNDGFGRMDPVRIYKNTTRDIGFSFKVAATSEQDFDEMWFKINKLITLLYPQWSAGEELSAGNFGLTTFTRPFSQVPVASPVIRLRIGDVIKSNYSRFNLSRIFGSGNQSTMVFPGDVGGTSILAAVGLLTEMLPGPLSHNLNHVVQGVQIVVSKIMLKLMLMIVGSPLQYVEMIPDHTMLGIVIKDIAFDLLSGMLRNGFMSPAVNVAFDRLRDPDGPEQNSLSFGVGAQIGDAVMLKPSNGKYYISPGDQSGVKDTMPLFLPTSNSVPNNDDNIGEPYIDGMLNSEYEKYLTAGHIKCRVVGRQTDPITQKTHYNIVAVQSTKVARFVKSPGWSSLPNPLDWEWTKSSGDVAGKIFNVTYDDFVIDPDYLFGAYFSLLLDPVTAALDQVQGMIDTFAGGLGISTDNINLFTTTFEDLMHPVNNSITKAFETTSGRGLAGVISSMSFTWIDGDSTPWETSFGSRAPKICDIKIKFEPIHDIAPGLDSDGFTRAPTHNVGSIMNNIAGDPYEKGFDSAKKSFDSAMSESTLTKNTE